MLQNDAKGIFLRFNVVKQSFGLLLVHVCIEMMRFIVYFLCLATTVRNGKASNGKVEKSLHKDLTFSWESIDTENARITLTLTSSGKRFVGFGMVNPGHTSGNYMVNKVPSYAAFASDAVEIFKLTKMSWKPGVPAVVQNLTEATVTRSGSITTVVVQGSHLGPLALQPADQPVVRLIWSFGEYNKKHSTTTRGTFELNWKTLAVDNSLETRNHLFRTLHGSFMTTIWAGSTLIGGIIARYWRHNPNWVVYHMYLQSVATVLTMPLTILSYVTKPESHYNTVHGQGGLIFGLLATVQGSVGTFVHASHQHRMGFVANPVLATRLRRFHRALGKALLVYATAQIALGIDSMCACVLESEVGISFVVYSVILWASVLIMEYRHMIVKGGHKKQRKSARGEHDLFHVPTYLGKNDLMQENVIYAKLVAIADVALLRLGVAPRTALQEYKAGIEDEKCTAKQMKCLACVHARAHRSLRNEVLADFVLYLAKQSEAAGKHTLAKAINEAEKALNDMHFSEILENESLYQKAMAFGNWVGYFLPPSKLDNAQWVLGRNTTVSKSNSDAIEKTVTQIVGNRRKTFMQIEQISFMNTIEREDGGEEGGATTWKTRKEGGGKGTTKKKAKTTASIAMTRI